MHVRMNRPVKEYTNVGYTYVEIYGFINVRLYEYMDARTLEVGLGDLGVTCSPRDPRFAGLSPTEVDEFFRTLKS